MICLVACFMTLVTLAVSVGIMYTERQFPGRWVAGTVFYACLSFACLVIGV
jgi:hypothetical protein